MNAGSEYAPEGAPKQRIGCLMRQALAILLLVAAATIGLALLLQGDRSWLDEPLATTLSRLRPAVRSVLQTAVGSATASKPRATSGRSVPDARRVGVVVGHYGPENDPGAVCVDGLREVDVNLAVAERVVTALRARGYKADLLEEYDNRLPGYLADALVSIHADSCDIAKASGFKVARVSDSAIPEAEDALVECLYAQYGRVTGLPRHDHSITPNMHGYHVFLEIDPQTPGAIIEIGFLGADRDTVENHPERAAEGIFAGLVCFLER